MDRNPSQPPAPRVYVEPAPIHVYATRENFMELVQHFTGQTASTNGAAAAQRGGIVPTSALEPVQERQPMVTTATVPTNGATNAQRGGIVPTPALEPVQQRQPMVATATTPTNGAAAAQRGGIVPTLALEPVLPRQPMVGMATAPGIMPQVTLSMQLSSDNPGPCILNKAPNPLSLEEEDAEEVEEDADEVEDPEAAEAIREGRFYLLPPGRNADAGEPKVLILFPLGPSSIE